MLMLGDSVEDVERSVANQLQLRKSCDLSNFKNGGLVCVPIALQVVLPF